MRSQISATSDSAPFDFHRLSGKNTSTEVDTLPDRFGSRSQVLDHKSISLRISWDQQVLERAADQQARFLIATNELSTDKLSDEALLAVYKGQGSVERGFRFLKDPLFLASSVFVKKPSRLVALSFIMVLCLLVYRLAEQRLRQRLQQSQQTIPNQVNKPTNKPTMRWVFQCFEGIELLHIRVGSSWQSRILRLQPLHQKILRLLGPAYQQFYFLSS